MQIKQYIELLTGDASTPVQWQVYHDSDKSGDGQHIARNWYAGVDESQEYFNYAQQHGGGVYATVNETDGKGRSINNISRVRACFIDGDDQPLPSEWAIDPDMVVSRSDTQWHAYWLLAPSTDFDTWQQAQYRLALYYGVKDRLHDLPRVMRAPGFNHLKNPTSPEPYNLIYANPQPQRHSLEYLTIHHQLSGQQQQELESWLTAPKQRKRDIPDVVDDSAAAIDRATRRVWDMVVEEGDLNNTLYRAANACKDMGLSSDNTVAVITHWWESLWTVPVEPKTILMTTRNAYKYGHSSIGAETTAGKFIAAPPVIQQVGSEEDLRVVVEGLETADVKYASNHTVNARVFLQTSSDAGLQYITVKQETYIFDGTHYRRLEPKELETHVLHAMLSSRPKSDVVNGTCKIVQLLTTNNVIQKSPSWIVPGAGKPKPSNLIAFKNGILDISDNSWHEHTPDLFYTHCLEYNYNPDATYDKWVAYLSREVFDDDVSLMMSLQEWIGYMLIPNYDYQRIAVFLGAPRSGKGTVAGVIRHLVGSHNVIAPTLSKLLTDSVLDLMIDKPVGIIGDAHKVPYNKRDEVLETLKSISGCDPMTFNRKYINATTCKFPTRFTLCANKMPEFLDSSGAMAGRLLVIPFRNSYLGREDPKRLEKLLEEAPGILNWALIGLRRLQENGKFTDSEDSEEIMKVIREELSPVSVFIEDCVTITGDVNDIVSETDVYNVYRQWCIISEVTPVKSGAFKSDFAASSYKIRRKRSGCDGDGRRPRVFGGVKITQTYDTVTPGKFPAVGVA